MRKLLRIEQNPDGPRVYVFGRRLHHGLVCALGVFICGIGVWDDWQDFPWLSDRDHLDFKRRRQNADRD